MSKLGETGLTLTQVVDLLDDLEHDQRDLEKRVAILEAILRNLVIALSTSGRAVEQAYAHAMQTGGKS